MNYFFQKRILKYLGFILSPIDLYLTKKFKNKEIRHQPVFIIGAPRTGSTILYQFITNYLNVSYINNMVYYGYKSLYISFKLSEFIFKNKPHNSTKSEFGTTDNQGLNAPSEGGLFWHRWLSNKKDYISIDEANMLNDKAIKNYITAITNKYNRPFLFKNLNCGMRIAFLTKMFPQSKFIFIKRNPVYTTMSILEARKKNNIKNNEWWSVRPKDYESCIYDNPIKQSAAQVFHIEKQIEEDLEKYSLPENHITIQYEDLINAFEVLNKVKEFMGNPGIKKEYKKDLSIKVSNKDKPGYDINQIHETYQWFNN